MQIPYVLWGVAGAVFSLAYNLLVLVTLTNDVSRLFRGTVTGLAMLAIVLLLVFLVKVLQQKELSRWTKIFAVFGILFLILFTLPI